MIIFLFLMNLTFNYYWSRAAIYFLTLSGVSTSIPGCPTRYCTIFAQLFTAARCNAVRPFYKKWVNYVQLDINGIDMGWIASLPCFENSIFLMLVGGDKYISKSPILPAGAMQYLPPVYGKNLIHVHIQITFWYAILYYVCKASMHANLYYFAKKLAN